MFPIRPQAAFLQRLTFIVGSSLASDSCLKLVPFDLEVLIAGSDFGHQRRHQDRELHRLIKHDMPDCTRGLRETWTQIAEILVKQEKNPEYQFVPELPTPGVRTAAGKS